MLPSTKKTPADGAEGACAKDKLYTRDKAYKPYFMMLKLKEKNKNRGNWVFFPKDSLIM